MYEYKAIVTKVVDGDTVDCSIDLGFDVHMSKRVRLLGIAAPESRATDPLERERGQEVEAWLKREVANKTITIKTSYDNRGRFGRVLGTLFVDGRDLNAFMLESGMVRPYGWSA